MRRLIVNKKTVEKAKRCRVIMVRETSRRVIGLIEGNSTHVCWVTKTGETFCSCPAYRFNIGLCKHLYTLIKLFTDLEVEVVE